MQQGLQILCDLSHNTERPPDCIFIPTTGHYWRSKAAEERSEVTRSLTKGMNGLRICDLCQRSIAPTEHQTVSFGNQDFHAACYHGQLQVLVAQQAGRARQMS